MLLEKCATSECGLWTILDRRINTLAPYITNRHSSLQINVRALLSAVRCL